MDDTRMHLLMALATVVWLVLIGLLWCARPGKLMWLASSMVLGIVYFAGFFWYVTRPK